MIGDAVQPVQARLGSRITHVFSVSEVFDLTPFSLNMVIYKEMHYLR